MKHADFIFELLCEELPPKSLTHLSKAFCELLTESLKKNHLNFETYNTIRTPRRLGIYISQLAEQQPEQMIERKGPAVNFAFDDNGNPTKAALGFLHSCQLQSMDELSQIETDKGTFLFYKSKTEGKKTKDLLPELIQDALKKLPVPKLMRWGSHDYSFIRPVHNVLCLLGNEVITFELYGCTSNNKTYGHRFHHPDALTINEPKYYFEQLKDAYVIAQPCKRRINVQDQIKALEVKNNIHVIVNDELLDEVCNLVEYPVALLGRFNAEFLDLPEEVLTLSMTSHQRYFPVKNANGTLDACFVFISNINAKNPEKIIQGNERVLDARFSDAQFFYHTDKKQPLENHIPQLSHITYAKDLGTLADKSHRLETLATYLAPLFNVEKQHAKRAAQLCKCDLLTSMVGEFPELQGLIGNYYAQQNNEAPEVAKAIFEHYLPRFAHDELPTTSLGSLLSIVDKLDTLVGFIGSGHLPSGDKDPFALRRSALGIIKIITQNNIPDIDISALIEQAINAYSNQLTNTQTKEQTLQFLHDRFAYWCSEQSIRTDIITAVHAQPLTQLRDAFSRIEALQHFATLPEAEALVAVNKRISNILDKNASSNLCSRVDEKLFEQSEEKQLFKAIEKISEETQHNDYKKILLSLAQLQKPANDFFTEVMVISENEHVKNNRLALLSKLRELFFNVADISRIQQ